jgi:hypothetical protein
MDKTNTIELLKHTIEELSDIMLEIYKEWKDNQTTTLSDCECMAESMYQMMVCKAKNVLLMSKGITLQSEPEVCIIDPSNIYPVVRSMFEMNVMFRCIYASSNNETERKLLLKIWKIRGNNNLTQIRKSELDKDYQESQVAIKKENEMLRNDIRNLMCELSVCHSVRDAIENCIKNESPTLKGFKFEHCEHCGSITSFRAVSFSDASMEFTQTSFAYAHFSAHSHPSYLGVEHFWKMYNLNAENNYTIELLRHTCLFLCYFMTDYCKYKDSYRIFYDRKASCINNLLNHLLHN